MIRSVIKKVFLFEKRELKEKGKEKKKNGSIKIHRGRCHTGLPVHKGDSCRNATLWASVFALSVSGVERPSRDLTTSTNLICFR